MLRTVTTDLSVGPKGLSVKNSVSETVGSSRATRMAVATSRPAEGKPSGQKVGQAGQESPGGVLLFPLSEDCDLAAPGLKTDAEGVLDSPEVFVSDSEERGEAGFGQGYGVIRFRNRLCSLRR